jgi:predicted MFS family arabinose efflux permease
VSSYIWAITAYLVPATVTLPVYARLSDRYGRKALLLTGMGLFLLGSMLSATAQDMSHLIVFRGLQGCGAGALEGLSFILVADLYGGRRNAALQGALAGLMGVSFIGGPLIGGFLADHVGWRSVFAVNLPIGAAAMAIVAWVLPGSIGRSESRTVPVDLPGIVTLTVAVGLLLVGLNERTHADAVGRLPAWTEPRVGGLIAAALAVLVAFVAIERRAPAPIVPLRLLTDRRVGATLLSGATATFGLFAGVLLPRYFQTVRDVSATHSGLLIYPLLLGVLVAVNAAAAIIVRRLAFRGVVLCGSAIAALGALGFATFDASTPTWQSLLFMGLLGLGIGPSLSGLQIALTRTVEPRDIGAALGTLLLGRQIGGAIALAAAETIYHAQEHVGSSAAVATGTGVLTVALAGALAAALAMASMPRGAGRLPQPTTSSRAAERASSPARSTQPPLRTTNGSATPAGRVASTA